ncbi:MAG: aminotransferase class V-fold PLP-dependent enzyme [Bacteroidales bacterium]|nr:aminotransferase class V-fold PLP-dependent enzyme [Bacteroidales bacterium]
MIKGKDFRGHAHELVDWIADYLENIEEYPVKSQVKPGDIYEKLPSRIPQEGDSFQRIMQDFNNIIMPGITHWQSPNFFAYFPANSSYASLLGEMLTATLGAQCMKWETSPAATELEQKVMEWLRTLLGLPAKWHGVIQDTASTSSLVALLTAREYHTDYSINKRGFSKSGSFRIYCSGEAHSSIEKAVRIAGFGSENLVKVETDEEFRMEPGALEAAIQEDMDSERKPLCVVATMGTTSTTSVDPLESIGKICKKYDLWLHVDAAYAGSAMILQEYRWMTSGLNYADSFVFNPHKWLFTNFDCSAYYVKDKEALTKTFQLIPEYLKTKADKQVNNYSDWGIQLGRRFRALKLWFVLRSFGVRGLQDKVRFHISIAKDLEERISAEPDFEVLAPRTVNLLCFRYHPNGVTDEVKLNDINERLLHQLNATGRLYITHTKLSGKYTLRIVTGQTNVEPHHVERAWDLIMETARKLA